MKKNEDQSYRHDELTIVLRMVDLASGRITQTVTKRLHLETLVLPNGHFLVSQPTKSVVEDPALRVAKEAVDQAVVALVVDGVVRQQWGLKHASEADREVIKHYAEALDYKNWLALQQAAAVKPVEKPASPEKQLSGKQVDRPDVKLDSDLQSLTLTTLNPSIGGLDIISAAALNQRMHAAHLRQLHKKQEQSISKNRRRADNAPRPPIVGYTIQLYVGRTERAMVEFLDVFPEMSGQVRQIPVIEFGERWYAVIQGDYNYKTDSIHAKTSLSEALLALDPWVRAIVPGSGN